MLVTAAIGGLAVVAAAAWLVRETPNDAPDPPAGLVEAGAALYAAHCATCHGSNLEGQQDWRDALPEGGYPAPPHDASGHTWHHPDSQLFEITKLGGSATSPDGFESRMPAFEDVLSDADIWAVLHFIKSRWPDEHRKHQEQVTRKARLRASR